MSAFLPTMAEAQAIGLCALARQKGLPDVHLLRVAVVQLHPDSCGWCDYPHEELIRILRAFRPEESDARRWWNLPARTKGEAIRLAQGAA